MDCSECASEIDGVWNMVRAELDGVAAPEVVVRNTAIEFTRGEYFVRFQDQTIDAGTFALSRPQEVRMLLLRGNEGPISGRAIACIYQLTGDRLRICYGIDGVAPTEFKTADATSRYLATYRRKAGNA